MLSNAVKIMIFVSDVQYYVPIKLCKTAGSIHLFKIMGMLKPENIKLNRNYVWDTLKIDRKDVSVSFNDNKINLPRIVTIKLRDKIKIRCLMEKEALLFNVLLKQGITWLILASSTQETIADNTNKKVYKRVWIIFQMACIPMLQCNFVHGYFRCLLPEETIDVEVKVKTMKDIHTFRRNCTTQIISCKPWSPRLCPYPSLVRRMQTYLELNGQDASQPCSNSNQAARPTSLQKTPVPKSPWAKSRRREARCPLESSSR